MNITKVRIAQSLLLCFCTFIGACTDSDTDSLFQNKDKIRYKYIVPENLTNDTTLMINSESDLQTLFAEKVKHFEDSIHNNGWVKAQNAFNGTRAKINLKLDTVYVINYTVDYYSDPSVYNSFSARFGTNIVNEINSVVDPAYRLSTKKKYICEWRLFTTSYQPSSVEKVASHLSPMCALIPSTKTDYTDRGYAAYTNSVTRQFVMSSYQLYIKYEDVSHSTIVLDIEWPFYVRNSNGNGSKGYEFIYAVGSPV